MPDISGALTKAQKKAAADHAGQNGFVITVCGGR